MVSVSVFDLNQNSYLGRTLIEGQKITYINSPTEKFWTDGFVVRPFEKLLSGLGLKPPKMFESTLKKVLTCGKSITILTLLKKQSYRNTFQEMVAPTDLYDKFLANLKQNLSIHKRQISVEKYSQKYPKKKLQSIPMLTEGPSVSDIIGDISEYDKDLIAAYDVIAADLPELETTQELSTIEDIEVQNQALIDPDRFLVLSNYGLDPLQPMTSILEDAFVPVSLKCYFVTKIVLTYCAKKLF